MAYSSGRDGKGSRDPYAENWQTYGQSALSDYLLKNYTDYDNRDPYLNYGSYSSPRGSDPLGIIQDLSRLNAFFDPITARYDEQAWQSSPVLEGLNWGTVTEPNRVFTPTKDEVQRFIDRQYADYMAAGNPGNDAMWLPRMEGDNVVTGRKNSGDGGILDKITSKIEPALALSGFAGPALGASIAGAGLGAAGLGAGALEAGALAGAPGYGAALESSLAGLGGLGAGGIDASWGANPTGSFSPGSYNPADPLGFAGDVTPTLGNVATPPVGEFTASQLPGGSLNQFGTGVLGTGAGGFNLPSLPSNPPMPPAQAELTTNNATPGNVTPTTGTNNPVTAGTGLTSGAANAANIGSAATTALGRLLDGTATASDWASLLGTAGSTALGVYGSNQQANSLERIANQARADRQPFLNKSLEWLNNPQAYQDGPGQSSLDAVLRGLSVQGNPFGSPTNIALAGDIANRNWQNAVTGFGNIGLSGQDSRNSLLAGAAGADRGVTASLASGLGSLTQPDNSLEGLLRKLQGSGLNLGNLLV